MSETCWAHKKWNKIASDIKLAFHSSTLVFIHSVKSMRVGTPFCPSYITLRDTCASQLNPKHFRGMSYMRRAFSGSGVTEWMSGNDCDGQEMDERTNESDRSTELEIKCPIKFNLYHSFQRKSGKFNAKWQTKVPFSACLVRKCFY